MRTHHLLLLLRRARLVPSLSRDLSHVGVLVLLLFLLLGDGVGSILLGLGLLGSRSGGGRSLGLALLLGLEDSGNVHRLGIGRIFVVIGCIALGLATLFLLFPLLLTGGVVSDGIGRINQYSVLLLAVVFVVLGRLLGGLDTKILQQVVQIIQLLVLELGLLLLGQVFLQFRLLRLFGFCCGGRLLLGLADGLPPPFALLVVGLVSRRGVIAVGIVCFLISSVVCFGGGALFNIHHGRYRHNGAGPADLREGVRVGDRPVVQAAVLDGHVLPLVV
mmetsp:Transcript_9979/g.27949  ORF Transcript_9979/g.27949 Transcript_9979/m.27949 type:complete len:275 (-) Transcript_9979:300-1124(-)